MRYVLTQWGKKANVFLASWVTSLTQEDVAKLFDLRGAPPIFRYPVLKQHANVMRQVVGDHRFDFVRCYYVLEADEDYQKTLTAGEN